MNYAHISGCPLSSAENWLNVEVMWLKEVRDRVQETGDTQVDEAVLEGHLGLTRELLSFLPSSKKYELGSDEKRGVNLIKVSIANTNCLLRLTRFLCHSLVFLFTHLTFINVSK